MWYANLGAGAESIREWLESSSNDGWEDQLAILDEIIRDGALMARPIERPDKGGGFVKSPVQGKIEHSMPHLRDLRASLQRRDRESALAACKAAIAAF